MQRACSRNLLQLAIQGSRTPAGCSINSVARQLPTRQVQTISIYSPVHTTQSLLPILTTATHSCQSSQSIYALLALIPSTVGIASILAPESAQADYSPTSTTAFTPGDLIAARPTARKEENTGVVFPADLAAHEQLCGLAARFMGGLVKVYAVGVYMDAGSAREHLTSWKGYSAKELQTAQPFWDVVCGRSSLHRVLRLVVVRDVGGNHMQQGFERALYPRVASKAKEGRVRPSEAKAKAKEFCKMFNMVGTMKIGSDIRISVDHDAVRLVVDERELGVVHSDVLAWALMDMFIGEKGVVKGLREDVADGFERILN